MGARALATHAHSAPAHGTVTAISPMSETSSEPSAAEFRDRLRALTPRLWVTPFIVLANVGVFFYIWVGLFSLSIIAQFWSYANDIYSKEAGSRLFPVIGVGMTAGAGAAFVCVSITAGLSVVGELFTNGLGAGRVLVVASAEGRLDHLLA